MNIIKCNLCGANNASSILSGRDRWTTSDPTIFNLVRCHDCSLVYINPQPTEEELTKFYPTDYSPYNADYQIFHYGYLLNFLKKIKQKIWPQKALTTNTIPHTTNKEPLKKVLDFGCGSGQFLKLMEEKYPNWTLYGFDIATNQHIENLGGRIKIYRGRIQDLLNNFVPQSLDVIYLNNSLEHLNDPMQTLSSLIPFLKNGGELNIEVPNIDSVKFKIFGKHYSSLDIPRHLYMFSPKTLQLLLQKNNLIVQKISLGGSSKCLLRSFYFFLHIEKQSFNPILFRVASFITWLTRNKLIDDVITVTATKP